ncbi:MAG: LuxR C-terminal-related transcriptional regulator, partial [Raoultibacter sp.]
MRFSKGRKETDIYMRGLHLNTCGILAAVGLGLNLVWCTLMGHTMGFMSSAVGIEGWVNPRIFFLMGILVLAVSYIALPRLLERADGVLRYMLPLISAFGTAGFGLSYHQTFFDPGALAIGGLFVAGIGYFWLVARYNLMLARTQGFTSAVWAVTGGLIVKLPILFALSLFVGPEGQVLVAIVLPIISAMVFEVAYAIARDATENETLEESGARQEKRALYDVSAKARTITPTSQTFRRNTFILMAVSAILLAVIRSVSYLGLWGNTNANISTSIPWLMGFIVPSVLLVLFAYFALIRMAGFTLTMRFQPAMLLILVGLFVVAIQANPGSDTLPFLTDVIQIDELFAHLLFWTVVITALNALDLPPYRVIGISGAIYAGASIAWVLLLGTSAIINNIFLLLATYVIVIAAMYVTWLGGKRRVDEIDETPDGSMAYAANLGERQADNAAASSMLSRTVADTCSAMAKHYALSPREAEVFVLLAQGRTRAFIQDELVLSGSTVKTH